MIQRTIGLGLVVIGLFLGPSSGGLCQAAQFYVEPAHGSGISQADLDTTTSLVRSSVGDLSYTLVDSSTGADFTLRPELLKLGNAYILSIAKRKGDHTVFSSQLKAANIEELDKVAMRVTQSVIEEKSAGSDARVGEITDQEARDGTQRRPTRHVTYLGIGGASLANLNAQHLGYSLGLATGWDTNQMLVKIMGELSGAGSSAFLSGGLGLNYFLMTTDVAPYVGADFGYGAAKVDGGSIFSGPTRGGFVLGGGAGIQLLRTSNINLEIGFRAGFLMNTNDFGRPAVYSLRAGLYF